MNKPIILFSIFVSIMLVTQIIAVHAEDSEARKKAKAREEQFAKESKDTKKKSLEDQKKALDVKPITITKKEPKGKAAAEATNAARQKALDNSETTYKNAKDAMDAAKKALNSNITNSTKKQSYENAKKAFEKAKIDRELTRLG